VDVELTFSEVAFRAQHRPQTEETCGTKVEAMLVERGHVPRPRAFWTNFSVSARRRMVAKSMFPPAIVDCRRKLRTTAGLVDIEGPNFRMALKVSSKPAGFCA
jgi:hypothetical protein